MTVRVPLLYNGSQLQQAKTSDLNNLYSLAVYYYSLNPSRVLSVSGSGGNLTSIDDTRLQAGAASTASGSFPSEATTAEPSVVTVSYQRITQTTQTANITTSDTGKTFPVYWTGTQIRAMTETDFVDTFILPAINLLSAATTTSDQAGTYHIATSDSVSGSTLVSSTPVNGLISTSHPLSKVTMKFPVADRVTPSTSSPPVTVEDSTKSKVFFCLVAQAGQAT